MSGYSFRTTPPYGYNAGVPTPAPSLAPSPVSKRIVEGYRQDILNGFQPERPRFNPMNADRVQSSALVDLQDPIQVHLLTETALLDSKQYEILSQEEVDGLKKQCQTLSQRIDQTRASLTIQSKYRDAAYNMTKLYSPTRAEGKRRSILSRSGSLAGGGGGGAAGADSNAREAEAERLASERRCEELAAELFSLEKRLMDPQRRLLQHTAGILQLTHRAASRRKAGPDSVSGMAAGMPGMPASPESLYTYSSRGDDDLMSDDGNAVRGGAAARVRGNTMVIPTRSPVRDQTKELRDEADRLRDENRALRDEAQRAQFEANNLDREIEALRQESARPTMPAGIERRMQELHGLIRELVFASCPDQYPALGMPAEGPIMQSLDYLERGLRVMRQAQDSKSDATDSGIMADAMQRAEDQVGSMLGRIEKILVTVNPAYGGSAPAESADLDGKLGLAERALRLLETQTAQALEEARAQEAGRHAEVHRLLRDLWESIQSMLIEARRRREQRRAAGQVEDDVSGDEMMDTDEEYSLPAFASKVRYITTKASELREHKSVLHRQIRQQRELNSKLSTDGEANLMRMQDDLDQVRAALEQSQKDAADAQVRLADALRGREEVASRAQSAADSAAALKDAETKLADQTAAMASLDAEKKALEDRLGRADPMVRDLTSKLAKVEADVSALDGQLADAVEAKRRAEQELDAKEREFAASRQEYEAGLAAAGQGNESALQAKEAELDRLNGMVVELKTELTFAQAELDGAYGSRAERAKEAAAIKNSQEVVRLGAEVANLKTQLAETVDELEQVTKETIGAEREKVDLEARLDDALAVRTTLETEAQELRAKLDRETDKARALIGKLQEELDAERLKVSAAPAGGAPAGAGAGGRGATMLSEQFRATMREERKKFQEDMREEQSRRRKLEDELGKMRRELAAGRR